jgi:hypothetical protein
VSKVPTSPGIYPGLTREQYEAIDAVNWSILKLYDRSPLHAKHQMDFPSAPTPAMERGTAVHMAVLEPDKFDDEYVVAPKVDRRTKAGKAEWAEFEQANQGKTFLSKTDGDYIKAVRSKIPKHAAVHDLLSGKGLNECAVVAERNVDGQKILCKSLVDRITQHDGFTWVIDLKSCQDAQPWAFGNKAASLDYGGQAAFYLDNLDAASPSSDVERRFVFLAWEVDPPYEPKLYEMDEGDIATCSSRANRLLRLHAKCVESNDWPGYSSEVELLRLPGWYQERS